MAIPVGICLPLLDVTEDVQELYQEHLEANEKRNIQPCNFCCHAPVSEVLGVTAATSLVRLRLFGVFEGSGTETLARFDDSVGGKGCLAFCFPDSGPLSLSLSYLY